VVAGSQLSGCAQSGSLAAVSQPAHREKLLPAEGSPDAGEEELERRLESIWESPHTLFGWLGTVDHKRIGIRYLVTAMAFLVVGGVEALVLRLQLVGPERGLLSPEAYGQFFTLHGVSMILWYAAPILSGFGNYLVPLLIGSRDMSFPKLNAFSYWTFLLSGLFLYASVLAGQATGATTRRTISTSIRWR
jgi:Cytochrome C and Quinol oxidase polypeptide I